MSTVTKYSNIITTLHENLSKQFPDVEPKLIDEELDGIITGFYNSIRWSVLYMAKDQLKGDVLRDPIKQLHTTDGFGSEWMTRAEIIEHISATSGLDDKMSEKSLNIIEGYVNKLIEDKTAVEFSPVGRLEKSNNGYRITLGQSFQLQPHENVAHKDIQTCLR